MRELLDAIERHLPDKAQSIIDTQFGAQRWRIVTELLDISLSMDDVMKT
jgi:hypothetical protein